jgi:acyl-CoA-binding protein
MNKMTQEEIVAKLTEREAFEWEALQALYHKEGEGGNYTSEETALIGRQRARWAAWAGAREIANGDDTTSFVTEQESI